MRLPPILPSMRLKVFSLAAFAVLAGSVSAQTTPLTTKLPIDPKVRIGTLKNGLRYYIRQNTRPEKRAELRLVVNAGSILETPDKLGLAHFVEHTAFNGTKHFAKNDLIKYLESIGVDSAPTSTPTPASMRLSISSRFRQTPRGSSIRHSRFSRTGHTGRSSIPPKSPTSAESFAKSGAGEKARATE